MPPGDPPSIAVHVLDFESTKAVAISEKLGPPETFADVIFATSKVLPVVSMADDVPPDVPVAKRTCEISAMVTGEPSPNSEDFRQFVS